MYQHVYESMFPKIEQKVKRIKELLYSFLNQLLGPLTRVKACLRNFFTLTHTEESYDKWGIYFTKIKENCLKIGDHLFSSAVPLFSHLAAGGMYTVIQGYRVFRGLTKESPTKLLAFGTAIIILVIMIPFIVSSLKIIFWAVVLGFLVPLSYKWILQILV
jgi:hypothetical protein